MRGLGRPTGWLGWVVAGVLLVSAGGAALAAQGATTTTQAPGASADKAKARAGVLGRGGGWRHGLGRRVLHGEVTVQTKDGVKTLVMAYGQVTVLSKDAITVKSSDGVETSFGIDGDTRYGFRNEPAPTAELREDQRDTDADQHFLGGRELLPCLLLRLVFGKRGFTRPGVERFVAVSGDDGSPIFRFRWFSWNRSSGFGRLLIFVAPVVIFRENARVRGDRARDHREPRQRERPVVLHAATDQEAGVGAGGDHGVPW